MPCRSTCQRSQLPQHLSLRHPHPPSLRHEKMMHQKATSSYSTIYSTLFLMTTFEVFFAVRLHPTENRTCKSIFKVPLWPWLSEPYPPSGWKIWNLVAQIPRHRQDSKTTRLHSFLDRIHQTESDYSTVILYIGEIPLTFILWRFKSHGKSHGKSHPIWDRDSPWRSKTKVWVP